jgi:hypothetical protein
MEWSTEFTVAFFGALATATGFVAKTIWEAVQKWRDRRLANRARLIELQSLVLASFEVFQTQLRLRNRLFDDLVRGNKDLARQSQEDVFAELFDKMKPSQKTEHGLIRSYTMLALSPLNQKMADWLSADTVHKSRRGNLGASLRQLEAHLVLWRAKYDFWIPEHPERALVYLAGSSRHGPGFPKHIEAEVLRATGSTEAEIKQYLDERRQRHPKVFLPAEGMVSATPKKSKSATSDG